MSADSGHPDDGPLSPRIGDAERQGAVEALSDHYVAGRLELVEFEKRTDAALRARTSADLAALFADLPGERGQQVVAPEPRPMVPGAPSTGSGGDRGPEGWIALVMGLLGPVMILSAIFLGLSWYVAIGTVAIGWMVLGQVQAHLKRQREALEPPDDSPGQLPPARPPSS